MLSKVLQIFVGGLNMRTTNPRWQTATILKNWCSFILAMVWVIKSNVNKCKNLSV